MYITQTQYSDGTPEAASMPMFGFQLNTGQLLKDFREGGEFGDQNRYHESWDEEGNVVATVNFVRQGDYYVPRGRRKPAQSNKSRKIDFRMVFPPDTEEITSESEMIRWEIFHKYEFPAGWLESIKDGDDLSKFPSGEPSLREETIQIDPGSDGKIVGYLQDTYKIVNSDAGSPKMQCIREVFPMGDKWTQPKNGLTVIYTADSLNELYELLNTHHNYTPNDLFHEYAHKEEPTSVRVQRKENWRFRETNVNMIINANDFTRVGNNENS